MTNEERDLITRFVARIGGAPAGGFTAPVAAQNAAPLPPVDREADALIAELFTRYPEARYRITQTAFVQEHALVEAQNRIQRLEWELGQAQQALQQAAQQQAEPAPSAAWGAAAQQAPQQQRGFLGGLFGGRPAPGAPPMGARPQAPYQQAYAPPPYGPPPAQYPPGYNPGLFQPTGSGFFGGALRTAAGVAGGMLAANALTSLFSGPRGGGFVGSAQAAEALPGAAAANPWAAPALPAADPYDQGGAAKQEDASGWTDAGTAAPDPTLDPSGGWDQAAADPAPDDPSGGWSDAGGDLGGGNDDWT